jgi:hypothetical protein
VDDNKFGVPAGWYPDPLGLPQLRWWDAQAWTEHTSEARAPIVVQPSTRLGFADDFPEDDRRFAEDHSRAHDEELPSRREQRERERRERGDLRQMETQTDTVQDELSAQPLLAMTLRELEPPLGDTLDEETPGPKRASAHANAAPTASVLSALAEDEAPERELKQTRTYTGAAWTIAIMPLLQVVASVLLITVAGQGHNLPILLVVWIAPYLLILGLAAYDKLLLQTWGHKRPAEPWWAVLTAPVYLVVRAIRTYRETGKGFGPIVMWVVASTSILVGVIALPGLVISLLPDTFSSEVEQSVRADALALGADLSLDCPTAPPTLIGESFTCRATKVDSGDTDSIVVSLDRENGWIAWHVVDWGNWVLAE